MMPKDWLHNLQSPRKFEFMLMSRTRSLINTPDQVYKYFDEEALRDRPWCMLHVMLIERKDDVASRLGVGVVHEDAWVNADPKTMFLKLE